MEEGGIPKSSEHFIETQNSMSIDEEEEYLKALNASLLIQTPLQVSLEMLQKRLRKQAKTIEALKYKLQLQEETTVDAKSLLERMQSVERGLLELKSSKLSPFIQTEILTRLEDLEGEMKEQKVKFNVHLETEALLRKHDHDEVQKKEELEIDTPSQAEISTSEVSLSTENRTKDTKDETTQIDVEKANPLEAETVTSTEQLDDFGHRLTQMESRLSAHEATFKDTFSRLEKQQSTANERQEKSLKELTKQISNKEHITYSDHEVLASKVDALEQMLEHQGQLLKCKEDEQSCTLNDVLTKLENLEKSVKVSEQRAETALSAALSSLETTTQKQDYATIGQITELQDQLKRQLQLTDVKECILNELDRRKSKKETSASQQERAIVETIQPGRATRFICLSCDRELDPHRPVPLGELPSSQGLLPSVEQFKTKSVLSLRPIGPGLNAAELRKLQFISEQNNSSKASPKQTKMAASESDQHKTRHVKTPLFL